MGRATELLQLPTKVVEERAARRRKLAIAAVGALVVTAGVGTAAAVFVLDAGKAVTLHKEWATFQGCMLGEPLEAEERPSNRYRLLLLAQLGRSAEAPGAKAWPATCLDALGAVVDTSSRAPAGGEDLGKAATAVGKAINTGSLDTTPKLLDDLWKAATTSKLTDAPGPRHDSTPRPIPVLFGGGAYEAQPRPLGDFTLSSIRAEVSASPTPRFLVDDRTAPKGPTVCGSEPGSLSLVSCSVLPEDVAKLAPGLRLLGGTDVGAAPLVFAGERGAGGVFKDLAGPALVSGTPVFGGASKAGKRARVLVRRPTGLVLVESGFKEKETAPTETRLRYTTDNVGLAGEWIFARDDDKLTVQKVGTDKVVDLGAMPEAFSKRAEDRVAYCRSGSTEVARIRGTENDFVTFGTDGTWSEPRKVRFTDQLSCAEGVAVMATTASTENNGRVHATIRVTRCTSAECKDTQLSHYDIVGGNAALLPPSRSELAVGLAGGRLYLVWFTGMGDLRVRSGAADAIASASDVVLYAAIDDSPMSAREVALAPATMGALLLARTGDGVRVFAFGQDGTVTPAVTKL
jgi:hypothetical protein